MDTVSGRGLRIVIVRGRFRCVTCELNWTGQHIQARRTGELDESVPPWECLLIVALMQPLPSHDLLATEELVMNELGCDSEDS
jgi:hypothetical protein